MKNILLLKRMQSSLSKYREIFTCTPKFKYARVCVYKAASRGHFYLLIGWLTLQRCYKAGKLFQSALTKQFLR